MKTFRLYLLLSALLAVAGIHAQEEGTTVGIKVGLNVANLSSTDDKEFDNIESKTGFHAGFRIDHAFSDKWHFLTGLEYSVKGTTIDFGSMYHDWDVTAAYIQLPLCAGFKIRPSDHIALLFDLGPYFAYGIHGKVDTGAGKEDTFSDHFAKNFDWGICLGATLEWQKLFFRLGGEVGMINIMQKWYTEAKMSNVALSVGCKF